MLLFTHSSLSQIWWGMLERSRSTNFYLDLESLLLRAVISVPHTGKEPAQLCADLYSEMSSLVHRYDASCEPLIEVFETSRGQGLAWQRGYALTSYYRCNRALDSPLAGVPGGYSQQARSAGQPSRN